MNLIVSRDLILRAASNCSRRPLGAHFGRRTFASFAPRAPLTSSSLPAPAHFCSCRCRRHCSLRLCFCSTRRRRRPSARAPIGSALESRNCGLAVAVATQSNCHGRSRRLVSRKARASCRRTVRGSASACTQSCGHGARSGRPMAPLACCEPVRSPSPPAAHSFGQLMWASWPRKRTSGQRIAP